MTRYFRLNNGGAVGMFRVHDNHVHEYYRRDGEWVFDMRLVAYTANGEIGDTPISQEEAVALQNELDEARAHRLGSQRRRRSPLPRSMPADG